MKQVCFHPTFDECNTIQPIQPYLSDRPAYHTLNLITTITQFSNPMVKKCNPTFNDCDKVEKNGVFKPSLFDILSKVMVKIEFV